MDKTRNKKRSRRKSRKITGGMDAAVLTKDGNILQKSSWTTITSLDKLNGYQVSYNDVTYTIADADADAKDDSMKWTGITDKSTLGLTKNKKWLIGDAISQIYGVTRNMFDDFVSGVAVEISTEKGENINSNKISDVTFTPEIVTIYYSGTIGDNGENQSQDDLSKYININEIDTKYQTAAFGDRDKPWEKKVLDYYLQTINQTSIGRKLVSTTVGAVKRAATKLATGKSMDAQLLEEKAKRVPIMSEIQEAFNDTTIQGGVYDATLGELTFKATLLTDGEGGYVVTDIKVAK